MRQMNHNSDLGDAEIVYDNSINSKICWSGLSFNIVSICFYTFDSCTNKPDII